MLRLTAIGAKNALDAFGDTYGQIKDAAGLVAEMA